MENKSHALAAGTFVLALVALLVALATWLARDSSEQRVYELSSPDAVTGLQPQASVRFKGVRVGKVAAIGFDPQTAGNVLIRIAVDANTPVTHATFASLGFQGVTGLAFVQLDDRGESREMLATRLEAPARIPMQPSLLTKVSDQGVRILTQLEDSSRRINQLLSPANQKTLMTAIDNMGQAATRLPALTQETSATLKTLQETSGRVGRSADAARESANAFKKVTERMNGPGGTLDKLATGADTLVATGHTLSATTLPRLNRVIEDAGRAVRQVSRAADTVSDNPQALIFGSGAAAPGPGEPGFLAPAATPVDPAGKP